MAYRFAPVGPYRLPLVTGQRALDYSLMEDVITSAVDDAERLFSIDLEESVGLYVFSLQPSGGRRVPYYVGQTCGQTLPNRALRNKDKKGHYDTILQECGYSRASPAITFLPLLTPSGRAASIDSNRSIINEAEIMLIGASKAANDELWNMKHNTDPSFEIMGLTLLNRRVHTEKCFAQMLGD